MNDVLKNLGLLDKIPLIKKFSFKFFFLCTTVTQAYRPFPPSKSTTLFKKNPIKKYQAWVFMSVVSYNLTTCLRIPYFRNYEYVEIWHLTTKLSYLSVASERNAVTYQLNFLGLYQSRGVKNQPRPSFRFQAYKEHKKVAPFSTIRLAQCTFHCHF